MKGATVAESLDKNRLKYPMMRDSLDEPFRRVSWDDALDRIVNRIRQIRVAYGSQGICMYGSGQFQTEDYYIAQKLMKGCLGTNNFDANSRLCMSSAVAGYIQSFGSDGPPVAMTIWKKPIVPFSLAPMPPNVIPSPLTACGTITRKTVR